LLLILYATKVRDLIGRYKNIFLDLYIVDLFKM